MVEQVRVNPEEVRGYGNICEEHTLEDFIVSNSGLAKEKENVHGTLTDVYKLVYSLYGLMFDFDVGNKQLYLQMEVADVLSFGFDEEGKQLYLVDEDDTGLSLGFDEDTNELYITDDTPPIVHNYTLALDSDSYTTTGSLSVSATLLDDGVAVSGATVSFTGGVSTVTATTNSSGVATATVTFSASGTLTATYSNVSDTATVTVQSYLFYDACDTDNTNLYDTTTNYSNSTLTFDSSNSCYTMQRTSGTGMASLWIKNLTVTDQVKITADIKLATTTTVISQGGPIIMNSAKNKGFLTMIEGYRTGDGEYSLGTTNSPNSHGTKIIASQTLGLDARNYWLTYELIIDGSSVELNIYNGSTLIKTGTITSSQLDSTGNIVGLLMSYGNGAKISVKNIKVESL